MANSFCYYCDQCGRTYPNQYAASIFKTAFKTLERENFPIGSCKDCKVNYENREKYKRNDPAFCSTDLVRKTKGLDQLTTRTIVSKYAEKHGMIGGIRL